MSVEPKIARIVTVNGIVQGVGFRPFVYQLAREHRLAGEVSNTSDGVLIRLEGTLVDIDRFQKDLIHRAPPLSRITDISVRPEPLKGSSDFTIVKSKSGQNISTLISPDVSVCKDCISELFDPADRRYRYPFINCTNCGPRYTIITDIPYDRPYTSMKNFVMCDSCQSEYDDPMNRRFHAQPNACPVCGPKATLCEPSGKLLYTQDIPDPIEKTATLLKEGHIVAVKGLGGFHLAVDAENDHAVKRLRKRKLREEKPLAIMSLDTEAVSRYASVYPEDKTLIESPQRPIVLLKKKAPFPLSEDVSPRNRTVGAMLAYTPLHYLLLASGFTGLVMTSANLSEEPIAIDNDEAFERLGGIADYFLIHDRDIYLRTDDSVVRNIRKKTRPIRRSRGFAPTPVFLRKKYPSVLAVGAELKNTICLTKDNRAFPGQHIGDLENRSTYEFFCMTIDHMKRILDIRPEIIAYDLHPDYISTQYAQEATGVEKVGVQHHHAHIVSCMAENQIPGPVIGFAFDGVGYGGDGTIWGGEVLVADEQGFKRAAHFATIPMPGAAAAIKEPWRMAVSLLHHAYGDSFSDLDIPFLKDLDPKQVRLLTRMMEKNLNSPPTSSLGRIFDGIAAFAGLRNIVYYEGQAAIELENIADADETGSYSVEWTNSSPLVVPTGQIVRQVADDIRNNVSPPVISARFHNTIVTIVRELADAVSRDTGIREICLSGGVFQNALLLEKAIDILSDKKYLVYTHTEVPANDGGISLGQAVIAGARR